MDCDAYEKLNSRITESTIFSNIAKLDEKRNIEPSGGAMLRNKDKRRYRQYIRQQINVKQAPKQDSNRYSYNLCVENMRTHKQQQQQNKNTWNNHHSQQDNGLVSLNAWSPEEKLERPQLWKRKVSLYSRQAYMLRKEQTKPEPLINDNKNQPMQQLFKFWGQMKSKPNSINK
eukprot:TCONS_00051206-protein